MSRKRPRSIRKQRHSYLDTKTHPDPRESITFYYPQDERDADQAPLSWQLIRRITTYTRPYAFKRNVLCAMVLMRGLLIPALAWMIGATINGPIANKDFHGIVVYSVVFFLLVLLTVVGFHFRQRLALELGEAVVHDMRRAMFEKLMTMPMSFFNRTKFGRIISRMTSDIDAIRVGVQDVAFVTVVQALQMIICAGLMAWENWKLFSIMLLLVPSIWIVNQRYRREASRWSNP